jgi:hypothetical protein
VGSSSFTKWTDVQNYFPDHPIINRGFGGSTLLDVMMYAGDVILPYNRNKSLSIAARMILHTVIVFLHKP